MPRAKQLLKIAGSLSFAVALFQVVISFNPSWSLYLGAPQGLISHATVLGIAGLFAALVFVIFGLYAFSGAGAIRALPMLRVGLLVIGMIYTLRGLLLIPQLLVMSGWLQIDESFSAPMLASSAVSLLIGFLYLVGTILSWHGLSYKTNLIRSSKLRRG